MMRAAMARPKLPVTKEAAPKASWPASGFFKADGSVGGGVTDRLCRKGAGNAEFFLMLSVHAGNGFAQLLADGGEQGESL